MWDVLQKTKFVMIGLAAVVALGCKEGDSGSEGGTTVDWVPLDPGKVTCDPFSESRRLLTSSHGMVGSLFYLRADQPQYTRIDDYLNLGQAVTGLKLYFNELYVPTRPFDRGFFTQSGSLITTEDGSTLYEYFALKVQGRLAASTAHPAGAYQMALLADDGAAIKVDQGQGLTTLVDNDGTHATKMACALTPLNLSDTPHPFELTYYQGPRYHIALTVMMRPWPASGNPLDEPLCNQQGNALFWDSTQNPPAPKAAFQNLLARGWKVTDSQSYYLPEAELENPCNEPAPVLTNILVGQIQRNGAVVTWTTDRAASSQVLLTNLATNVQSLTTLDTTLIVNHSVTLTGLTANTLYKVNAVSASISGATTQGADLLFRTSR